MSRKWIITASVDEYDILGAVEKYGDIWSAASAKTSNIEVDDIVYLYVGAPYKKIMYKFV